MRIWLVLAAALAIAPVQAAEFHWPWETQNAALAIVRHAPHHRHREKHVRNDRRVRDRLVRNESAPQGSGLVAAARAYLGTNPTGWTHVWCGKFMSMIAPSAAARIHNPNRAIEWASLPHVNCQVGAVAVLRHHVGVVSQCGGNAVRLVSGNHGHRVGEGDYSARRIVAFVRAD